MAYSFNPFTGNFDEVKDFSESLTDLSDVTITTPAEGEIIAYVGGEWVNSSPLEFIGHDDLDDMPDTAGTNTDHDNRYALRALYNGTIKETFDATVASSGGTITLSLEQKGGGDLTMQFSDFDTTLDCTPAQTVALTAGSDTSPQENFVYIPQSTKTLTASDTEWPSGEHIKVAYVLVQSAVTSETTGPLINQNWNDHLMGTDNQGHLTHMTERSRRLGAVYYSGAALTPTISTAPTPDELDIAVTAGVIYQMHQQTFPAFDTTSGDLIYVVNHPTTAYTSTTNLEAEITSDSAGTSLSNKYFNIVLWGVANKGAESFSPVMCNLPGGSYNNSSDAQNDIDGYDIYSIPDPFFRESSTGFLIARLTLKFGAGTNTLTLEATTDLRGFTPFTATGAGGTSATQFPDNQFTVFGNLDSTKILAFDCDTSITTGNTSEIIIPQGDGTMALLSLAQDFTAEQTFSAGIQLNDSDNITFGTGDDVTLDFDATNLVLTVNAGDIRFNDGSDDFFDMDSAGNTVFGIAADADTAFRLYDNTTLIGHFGWDNSVSKIVLSGTTLDTTTDFIRYHSTSGLEIAPASGAKLGFYNTTPLAQQTGVAVTAAGIHAALVSLGLITA